MKSELQHISGFKVFSLPDELNKLGDLMYFDGPLMSIYTNQQNEPFVFDWVEASEKYNRWLVYKVEKEVLADYIFGRKTHFELLNSPVNDIVFSIEKDSKGVISNCIVLSIKNLPYDYLPEYDLKFDKEDSLNLDYIINGLKLENISYPLQFENFDILQEAKKNNSELINLHIKSSSSKVGFGKIYSSVLGQVLTNYHRLTEATAINIFDEKGKLPVDEKLRRKKGELNNIKELAEMEFVYAKAASFSVFLRPIKNQMNLFDTDTSSEKIAKNVFSLFDASTNIEQLKVIKSTLNEDMLTSYNTFLKEIKEQDITLTVQYGNPLQDYKLEETFSPQKSNQILSNLDILEFENQNDIKIKGWFKALDSLSHTFKFETNEGDIYSGKFSNQLYEGISHFNLIDYYMIIIQILKSKKSGLNKISEKVTMISCIKEE